VCTTAAIAAVRSAQGGELVAHEMLVAGTAVPASTKNADLVYEIAFLHGINWGQIYRKRSAWLEMKDPNRSQDLSRTRYRLIIGS